MSFNTEIKEVQTPFTLRFGGKIPTINKINAGGGTNLAHIGNRMPLKKDLTEKIVIAFTDGDQNISELQQSMADLRELQKNARFAYPFLCKIGGSSESAWYFNEIAKIFAGSYNHAETVDQFFDRISSQIKTLVRANRTFVLTLQGTRITLRQPDDLPGLLSTGRKVKEGDSIVSNGITTVIDQSQKNIDLDDIKIIPVDSENLSEPDLDKMTKEQLIAYIMQSRK